MRCFPRALVHFISFLATLSVANGVAIAQPPAKSYGTYTTLSGFNDLQSTGNPCQYIRYNRRTGMLHAIFQVALDSLNPQLSRRTAYAFSPFGGFIWNNCNNIMLGNRRTDFASLDLIPTTTNGYPVIITRNSDILNQSNLFVDVPEGSCNFTEIQAPGLPSGSSSPEVAAGSDGSLLVAVSNPQNGSVSIFRTVDYITWTPPLQIPGITSSLFTIQGNDSGRVGIVLRNADGSIHLFESSNNGITWQSGTTQIIPPQVVVGTDTFSSFLGADLAYLGNTPAVAVTVSKMRGGNYSHRDASIGFWSPSTGFRIAVPHNRVFGAVDTLNRQQAYHLTVGYPSIGIAYGTIVIAFQAFKAETSASGFNYSDVYSTYSGNGGQTWSTPMYLTYNPRLDERYPSVSKWNGTGQPYIVWQEDSEPGSHIVDGAPVSRCRQAMFTFIDLPVKEEHRATLPERVMLYQNYPNPFNPGTAISFQLSAASHVKVIIYGVLGVCPSNAIF